MGQGYCGRIIVNTVQAPAAGSISPSDDTTYKRTVCIVSLYCSVEKTVVHIHISSVCMTDDTASMTSRGVHFCRYPYMVDGNGGSTCLSDTNKTGRMHTTTDFTRQVQILDGHVTCIAEKRTRVITMFNVNIQRVTITVESATIGSICI